MVLDEDGLAAHGDGEHDAVDDLALGVVGDLVQQQEGKPSHHRSASLRRVVRLVLLRVVRRRVLQDAPALAGEARHLPVARRHLDRHDVAAVVRPRRTQLLRHRLDQSPVCAAALKQLLTRLQLVAHHVRQRLEIPEQNSLHHQLTIQHLHVPRLHVAPGVDLLHVIWNAIILGNRTLLLCVHYRSDLLHSYE